MSRRWILILTISIILVAAALTAILASGDEDKIATLKVERATVSRRITAEGTLEATKATPLNAPVDAQGAMKIGWIADDQLRVKAGDAVVRFDPTDFENDRRLGSVEQQKTVNRSMKSVADRSANASNLGRDASQAEMELRMAQAFAFDDPDIYSRYQRVESEIDTTLASSKKDHARSVRSIRDSLAMTDGAMIAIDRRKADLKVQQADKALNALTVVAPHDGIVVLKRDWRGELPLVGATVWSGTPLAEIPELDVMKAEVFVLEADAGGVREGQVAKITLESLPGRTFPAKVARIDKVAKPRFRGVPVQYFGVTLEFVRTPPELRKPGARISAAIELAAEKNAIFIPRQAVFEVKGKRSVYKRVGEKFVATPIELGTSSAGRVVVTKGLNPGDEIALRNPESNDAAEAGEANSP